jgi:flagellar basal body rod protein FlgG
MDKGIYIALTGGALRMMDIQHVASNVANVSTDGYKRTSFSTRLYPMHEALPMPQPSLHPTARSMANIGTYSCDQSQGTVQSTGNPLDLAVNGEGFFCVDVKGETKFTRNGTFSVDKDGFLVNGSGYKIVGTNNQPISIGKSAAAPVIATDGTITVEGNTVGTIKLVKLKDVQSVSDSLYSGTTDGSAAGDIKQGSVERSNVNPMRELVTMIVAQREFQTIQQLIKSFDQMTSAAITQIARI